MIRHFARLFVILLPGLEALARIIAPSCTT